MRRPSRIAGSLDHYRPRALRARAGRGLARMIGTMAAPITITTSAAIAADSGAPGSGFSGGTGGHIYTGDPITGAIYAICGHSVCDNALQVCGP